jgi:serine/threonine protein kinase
LLHRDIKPSNILIRRDGTPLLSDFGLVRDSGVTLTEAGQFAGTPAYAAPEQLRGDLDRLDARCDVYSLAATLYHALALRPPFEGSTPGSIFAIEAGSLRARRSRGFNHSADFTVIARAGCRSRDDAAPMSWRTMDACCTCSRSRHAQPA